MATKYKVYERKRGKKDVPKMKPDDDYPPKYKTYRRKRPKKTTK